MVLVLLSLGGHPLLSVSGNPSPTPGVILLPWDWLETCRWWARASPDRLSIVADGTAAACWRSASTAR